jgi:hypothetical protein
MATKPTRVRLKLEASNATDYSKPFISEAFTLALTPDEVRSDRILVSTSGTSYSLAYLNSCSALIFHNLDSTNKCNITLQFVADGDTCNFDLPAGQTSLLVDIDVAVTMTLLANTADVELVIIYTGT